MARKPKVASERMDEPESKMVGGTSTDRVRETIRTWILENRFEPGSDLREQLIKKELAKEGIVVSRMPIRQALLELEKDGFVQITPKVGTKVRCINTHELRGIWDNRAALEEFIICQLASMRHVDLTKARSCNQQMLELAKKGKMRAQATEKEPQFEKTQRQFVDLDIAFHDALAEQAQYPTLAAELQNLRLRLHQYVFPHLFSDADRMQHVVDEHNEILSALTPNSLGLRPDITAARMAIRSHLRNSARRWRIDNRIRYAPQEYYKDFIFDLPDGYKDMDKGEGAISICHLLALRLNMELAVAVEIASRPWTDLTTVKDLNREMWDIAKRCLINGPPIDDHDKAKFINLDIGFHATLAFLSGLLFIEDGIIHAWRRLYKQANQDLTIDRMREVVNEHDKILDVLYSSEGKLSHRQQAVQAVCDHLVQAAKRNFSLPSFKSVALTLAKVASLAPRIPRRRSGA